VDIFFIWKTALFSDWIFASTHKIRPDPEAVTVFAQRKILDSFGVCRATVPTRSIRNARLIWRVADQSVVFFGGLT
jgi:hypothetical protein